MINSHHVVVRGWTKSREEEMRTRTGWHDSGECCRAMNNRPIEECGDVATIYWCERSEGSEMKWCGWEVSGFGEGSVPSKSPSGSRLLCASDSGAKSGSIPIYNIFCKTNTHMHPKTTHAFDKRVGYENAM